MKPKFEQITKESAGEMGSVLINLIDNVVRLFDRDFNDVITQNKIELGICKEIETFNLDKNYGFNLWRVVCNERLNPPELIDNKGLRVQVFFEARSSKGKFEAGVVQREAVARKISLDERRSVFDILAEPMTIVDFSLEESSK